MNLAYFILLILLLLLLLTGTFHFIIESILCYFGGFFFPVSLRGSPVDLALIW